MSLSGGKRTQFMRTRTSKNVRRVLNVDFQIDRLMPRDIDWIDDLAADEAQAALANLDTNKGPFSVREVVELRRLRNAERGTKIKWIVVQTCPISALPSLETAS